MTARAFAKNWCFTLNNPSEAERRQVIDYCERVPVEGGVHYIIFQAEKAPDTGTIHV